jgi:hypothetical protein
LDTPTGLTPMTRRFQFSLGKVLVIMPFMAVALACGALGSR